MISPVVKRIISALATAVVVVLAIIYSPPCVYVPIFIALFLLGGVEAFQLIARRLSPIKFPGMFLFLLALVVLAVAFFVLPLIAMKFGNRMMLYVIAIVKISDMGGFALGLSTARLMKGGNHKMCPMISPNKSWEGLVGSVLAAVALSLLFMPITNFAWMKAVAFGIVAALIGTAGDLVESKFKRWAGVKDSATFMPAGLGGFLDMFDSLLFAPAVMLPFI